MKAGGAASKSVRTIAILTRPYAIFTRRIRFQPSVILETNQPGNEANPTCHACYICLFSRVSTV